MSVIALSVSNDISGREEDNDSGLVDDVCGEVVFVVVGCGCDCVRGGCDDDLFDEDDGGGADDNLADCEDDDDDDGDDVKASSWDAILMMEVYVPDWLGSMPPLTPIDWPLGSQQSMDAAVAAVDDDNNGSSLLLGDILVVMVFVDVLQ